MNANFPGVPRMLSAAATIIIMQMGRSSGASRDEEETAYVERYWSEHINGEAYSVDVDPGELYFSADRRDEPISLKAAVDPQHLGDSIELCADGARCLGELLLTMANTAVQGGGAAELSLPADVRRTQYGTQDAFMVEDAYCWMDASCERIFLKAASRTADPGHPVELSPNQGRALGATLVRLADDIPE